MQKMHIPWGKWVKLPHEKTPPKPHGRSKKSVGLTPLPKKNQYFFLTSKLKRQLPAILFSLSHVKKNKIISIPRTSIHNSCLFYV